VDKNLHKVTFVDANSGWIAGDGGNILHTADGGNTWQKQNIGSEDNMTSVHFLDVQTGWAAGNSPNPMASIGSVYSTTDGGTTWKSQTVAEVAENTLSLNDIYFADSSNGWAVGGRYGSEMTGAGMGIVILTQDGGSTWKAVRAESSMPLSSVNFADGKTGWVFGAAAALKSEDGGNTWASMIPPPPPPAEGQEAPRRRRPSGLMGGILVDAKFWGINTGGRIVNLSEDGARFVPVETPLGNLTDISFISAGTGCAVGQYGAILMTEDGGASWSVRARINADVLKSVAAPSETNSWAVGSGVVCKSADGGQTWEPVDVGVKGDFRCVEFVDANTGWILGAPAAAGGGGRPGGGPPGGGEGFPGGPGGGGGGQPQVIILKTTDGGNTWIPQAGLEASSVFAISAVDAQNVYITGGNGGTFSSNDGGTQWTQGYSGVTWDLVDVHFPDTMNGFAVGMGGLIVRTNDGGYTWMSLMAFTAYDLNGVYFVTDKKGWLVGSYGIILTTDDGGDTWSSQRCYSYDKMNTVYFADATRGWVAGDSGKIFATTDGGETWNAVDSKSIANFNDIKAGADGSIWVAGEWGTVIKGSME